MPNRPRQFRHHDIVRAFRAASAAGVRDPVVQVQCPNGTVFTIGGKPDKVVPKPDKAPRSSRLAR